MSDHTAALPSLALGGLGLTMILLSMFRTRFGRRSLPWFLAIVGSGMIEVRLSTASRSCEAPRFDVVASYPAGTEPTSIATGDFNSDGITDLIVLNQFASASLLLGTGAGAFQPPLTIELPGQHLYLAVGDLNGDGKSDLVVSNSGVFTISVWLGTGRSTFTGPKDIRVVSYAGQCAIADFDNDGKKDLAISIPHTIEIALGNGDGTFKPPVYTYQPTDINSIAVGDFNRDGRADVVLANKYDGFNTTNRVSVYLGTGTGTFTARVDYPVANRPAFVAVGDFNGDGITDLVTAGYESDSVTGNLDSGNVSILLGSGTGSFSAPTRFSAGPHPKFVAVGDFNNDRRSDLFVVNNQTVDGRELGSVSILLGKGDGRFNTNMDYFSGYGSSWGAIGDFNGDGRSDLAVANHGNFTGISDANVSVLTGVGDGRFIAANEIGPLPGGEYVVAGDFNNDGNRDVAVRYGSPPNGIGILLGTGTGTFTGPMSFPSPDFANSLSTADLNGDGILDLVVTTQSPDSVQVHLGSGNGSFIGPNTFSAGRNPSSAAAADFDSDGKSDLIVANAAGNDVSLLRGNGDGTFSSPANFAVTTDGFPSSLEAVVTADFNLDGKYDIAVAANTRNTVAIMVGSGTGSFGAPSFFAAGRSPQALIVDDFDKDGNPDLAVANRITGEISILLGDGTGRLKEPKSYSVGGNPFRLASGDFNGDGKTDLAVPNYTRSSIAILTGTGVGTFSGPTFFQLESQPYDVAIEDFNGDKKSDLIVADFGSRYLSLLLNACGGSTGSSRILFPLLVTASDQFTGIALVNLDEDDATLRFTAYDRMGTVVSGTNVTNPASRTLKAGSQLPILDVEVFGEGLTSRGSLGWFKVESTVRKLVGFSLIFDPALTFLDGADVSSETLASFVFPEVESEGFTQIHVANPSGSPASVDFELVRADGSVRGRAGRTLNANAAVVELLSDLFPGVTPASSDYVRGTPSQEVAAFESLGKSGRFIQGLNGQATVSGARTLYCPQYVVGGSTWRSTLSVVNVDGTSGTVTFRFMGDDGAELGRQERQIAPRAKIFVTEQNFFFNTANQRDGYLEVTSNGPRLTGSVVFGDQARAAFSTALPLPADLRTDMVFAQVASAYASSPHWFTGLALLNPGDADANATVRLFNENGAAVRSATFRVTSKRRLSQLLTQYFQDLAGQDILKGYVRVTADQPLASFALFGTTNLSVLSAIPPQGVP